MSVVVRMEMPKSCDACPCLDDYGDYPRCRISEEQRGYNFPICEKRMPNCPIICQLPEGHGRLVDERELFARCRPVKNFENPDSLVIVMGAVIQSQTIVPAEAERSET